MTGVMLAITRPDTATHAQTADTEARGCEPPPRKGGDSDPVATKLVHKAGEAVLAISEDGVRCDGSGVCRHGGDQRRRSPPCCLSGHRSGRGRGGAKPWLVRPVTPTGRLHRETRKQAPAMSGNRVQRVPCRTGGHCLPVRAKTFRRRGDRVTESRSRCG